MEETKTSPSKGILLLATLAWVGHLVLLIAGLVISYILAGNDHVPDIALFIGRFHPMVLHFPVGVLVAVILLEILALFKPSEGLSLAGYLLLALGTHTAVLAVVMGLFLASEGGYNEETLFWHKWLGFGVAVTALLASGCKIVELKGSSSFKLGYRVSLFLAFVCLNFGGHEGANLTHGKTYLFEYAPNWLASMFGYGEEQDSENDVSLGEEESVFKTVIFPIFKDKCIKCHGEEKQKGDYRLDTHKDMMKAGESEIDPIVAGIPAASYLVELITLAEDADEIMPPEGKGELTDEEVMAIIRWVADGAVE